MRSSCLSAPSKKSVRESSLSFLGSRLRLFSPCGASASRSHRQASKSLSTASMASKVSAFTSLKNKSLASEHVAECETFSMSSRIHVHRSCIKSASASTTSACCSAMWRRTSGAMQDVFDCGVGVLDDDDDEVMSMTEAALMGLAGGSKNRSLADEELATLELKSERSRIGDWDRSSQ